MKAQHAQGLLSSACTQPPARKTLCNTILTSWSGAAPWLLSCRPRVHQAWRGLGAQEELLELQAMRDMAQSRAQEAVCAARDAQHELDGITLDLHEARAAFSLIQVRAAHTRTRVAARLLGQTCGCLADLALPCVPVTLPHLHLISGWPTTQILCMTAAPSRGL